MVVADAGLPENRRAPATTLEGWRSFISVDLSELVLLPAGQWQALDEQDRRDYDEARIAHHAELVVEWITWVPGEFAHLGRNADLLRVHLGGWPNWQTAAQTAPGVPRLATTS